MSKNKKQSRVPKSFYFWSAIFMVPAGSLAHFTYEWSGENIIVGLLSAMNESVWEHSKLFIVPLFIVGLIEYLRSTDKAKILWAKLVQFVVMSIFITVFFYTYTGALGIEEILWVDITSFIVAIIIGQYVSYKIVNSRAPAPCSSQVSAALLIAIFGIFVYTSFSPPELPLFQSLHSEEGHR